MKQTKEEIEAQIIALLQSLEFSLILVVCLLRRHVLPHRF